MQETWVEIDGYPNYAVSDAGNVLNLERETILTPRDSSDGGLRVALSHEGQVRDFYIHHLVARAFFRVVDPRDQVLHWNGDKTDNRPENLRFRKRQRIIPEYSRPENELLFEDNRRWGRKVLIKETNEVFRTVRDCANYIEGDYATIYACLRGERRTHRGFTFEYYYDDRN